jgi:hypothetical protein
MVLSQTDDLISEFIRSILGCCSSFILHGSAACTRHAVDIVSSPRCAPSAFLCQDIFNRQDSKPPRAAAFCILSSRSFPPRTDPDEPANSNSQMPSSSVAFVPCTMMPTFPILDAIQCGSISNLASVADPEEQKYNLRIGHPRGEPWTSSPMPCGGGSVI